MKKKWITDIELVLKVNEYCSNKRYNAEIQNVVLVVTYINHTSEKVLGLKTLVCIFDDMETQWYFISASSIVGIQPPPKQKCLRENLNLHW